MKNLYLYVVVFLAGAAVLAIELLGTRILRQLWVPAIPGINYPGDYQRDFGSDPLTWLRKWKPILERRVDRVIRYGYRMPKESILEG